MATNAICVVVHMCAMMPVWSLDGTHLEVSEQLVGSCFILFLFSQCVVPRGTNSSCQLRQLVPLLINYLA